MKWQVRQGKAVISVSDTIFKIILETVVYYGTSMITFLSKMLRWRCWEDWRDFVVQQHYYHSIGMTYGKKI